MTDDAAAPRRRVRSSLQHLSAPHRRLVEALIDTRLAAGLTGGQLGASAGGWSQSKISKIETGRTRPSPEDVATWLTLTGVDDDRRVELLELADVVAVDSPTWTQVDRDGIAAQQRTRQELEADAKTIRIYQAKVIPGLFQTPDYTRFLLLLLGRDPAGIDAAVAARAARQNILYDSTKTIEAVIAQRVLRWRPGPPAVTIGQLLRLLTFMSLPNVHVGIVSDQDQETARESESFVLKRGDDAVDVQVENLTREHTYTGAEDITKYNDMFDYQNSIATRGDGAVELVERSIAYLRTLE